MATTCTVLTDQVVRSLLLNLRREQVEKVRDEIARSLVEFSTTEERKYQPDSTTVTRPDGRSILFRPFTSSGGPGVKIIVDPTTPAATQGQSAPKHGPKPTLHGILVVCDVNGLPKGLINADEVTAYRTSMSVMIPYSWRKRTARVVVFGAGKVALWHVRLMLALRGCVIENLTVVNRSAGRAEELVAQVRTENERLWKSQAVLEVFSTDEPNAQTRLESLLNEADVICCTTPSSTPVFTAHCIKEASEASRTKFISGIGSWQPSMVELDPALIQRTAKEPSGLVVVDDRDSAMQVAGEIIQSKLRGDDITEVGQIIDSYIATTKGELCTNVLDSSLKSKLEEGNVIYKSVGVSYTDLAAANVILALATDGKQGLQVEGF